MCKYYYHICKFLQKGPKFFILVGKESYTGWERIIYYLGNNLLLVGKESYTGGKESYTGLRKNHVMPPLLSIKA